MSTKTKKQRKVLQASTAGRNIAENSSFVPPHIIRFIDGLHQGDHDGDVHAYDHGKRIAVPSKSITELIAEQSERENTTTLVS